MALKIKFLILTDCGEHIGFGHLHRCSSIKMALEHEGVDVTFMVFDDRKQDNISSDWYMRWPAILKKTAPTHLLIDSFRVDEAFFDSLRTYKINTYIIDDFPERDHKNGTVINWTVGADVESFLPRQPNVNYLLGTKYCCLREAFSNKVPHIDNFESNNVLITFGGSDIRELSKPVVNFIANQYPSLSINLVLGKGAKKEDYSSMQNVSVHNNCEAEEMCELMDRAEFAICGGGQTLYEMASRGLPPIIIPLIDNQLADIKGFTKRKFGFESVSWDNDELINNLALLVDQIRKPFLRREQASNGLALVDGKGLERLIESILQ